MKRSYLALLALIAAGVALLPPMHGLAHDSFAWHMGQHLVLIFVVAPSLALAVPERAVPRWLLAPATVVVLHATAVWAWHLPVLYDKALEVAPLHAIEHLSFVVTAGLFWMVVLGRGRRVDHLRRAAVVFATGLGSAALGALLVFAREPLYDAHLSTIAIHGMTPLEDQQLAGGIMWIPPGVVYLCLTLGLFLAGMNGSSQNERAVSADGEPL